MAFKYGTIFEKQMFIPFFYCSFYKQGINNIFLKHLSNQIPI